ncbi:MAG: OmpW family protein [Deltaproteobacteria bacterium]|nr:OmpW family protein [Deltaproteobacteria bacterium]
MKKKSITPFFVVIALMFVVSQVSFAQGMEGRLGLGARVSYMDYSDDDYTLYGVEVDVEPDEDVMYEGNLTYFIQDYFSIELSVGYVETDVDLSALGLSGDAGDLESIPVLLSGRMHFSTNPKLNPYISFGVGYFFNDIDQNDSTIEFIYGAGADLDVDDSFGFHLGAGVEFFISKNAAFNLDFKYIWTEVEAEVNKPGFTEEDLDINPYVLGLGIKYYF